VKQFFVTCAVAALLGFAFPSHSSAQVNAIAGGTVSDVSGGVIPKADITARNVNTGIVSKATSNQTGNYEFPSLQPGSYTLSASISGFQTSTYNDIQLGQGQQVRLNFTLQVGTGAQAVEVVAEADTLLATTSASVGGVLESREVSALPVATRNVLDLITLTPGVVTQVNAFGATVPSFAGTQTSQVNTTRDGMTTNDGRYNNGAYSAIFTSPDMVEEVRVSTNSIDPALGRGSAQVQMRTRSGSNDYHGALFYTNNNSKFNAMGYFQNLQGQKKDYLNRNQFGGRLGGPIKKNKAFFFVLVDNQRYLEKINVVSGVLTAQARQGNFRYLTANSPGGATRRNGNAFSTTPSVDLSGNVLTSANGTPLYMNSFNLFTDVRDPNRTRIDPVWVGPQYLNRMPLPNNYTIGDGLNTAGFQWQRVDNGLDGATGQSPNPNRNHLTLRFDYQINDSNKVSFIMSREHDYGVTSQTGLPDYPNGYFGDVVRNPNFYTASWTSTLSPTILNEFRFGLKHDPWQGTSPFDLGCCWDGKGENEVSSSAKEARASFPQVGGSFLYTQFGGSFAGLQPNALGLYAGLNVSSPRQTISPFTQFADTLSWNRGAHSFQGGFEIDRTSSKSSNSGGTQTTRPIVTLGQGNSPVPNINATNFGGISPNDITVAQDLLANLAGSVANITEQFYVNSPTATSWLDYTKTYLFNREIHSNAWSAFFKDNWKLSRNLTLNLGVRYDFFGTPYEANGLGGRFTGGQAGLFSISGNSFSAMNNPNATGGAPTTTEFVGKDSANPDKLVYNNDRNNFAPSIGISWSLPWFKRDTVIRAGYGINYTGNVDYLTLNTNIGSLPGIALNQTTTPSSYLALGNVDSGLVPLQVGTAVPFAPVPLNGPRNATIIGYSDKLRTPYVQSFNVAIQREVTRSLTVDVSYIANKGTKLLTNQQINDQDILNNGFLEAFNVTRAGGNAPLFDKMLKGLNVTGVGVVDGVNITGSQALRRFTTTNQFIANGSIASLANFLNTTTALTGVAGGILRNGGLSENFFVVNPQFGSVSLVGNNGNSTYNSVQIHASQRFSHGVTGQGSYTFSKTLGDNSNNNRDQNNLRLSKSLLSIDRPNVIQANVFWEPLGRKGSFFHNLPTWTHQAVDGWQISSGFSHVSGVPLSLTSATTTTTGVQTLGLRGSNTADIVGSVPDNLGQVVKGNGFVQYFPSLTTKAAPVPNFGGDATLPGRFTNQVVVDSTGKIVFQNAAPGTTGNLAVNLPWLRGPSTFSFNGALSKEFSIREGKTLTIRADAINLLNKPIFGVGVNGASPVTTDINSASFGRITNATGSRTITFNARVDF
jgi:hypothetical protein